MDDICAAKSNCKEITFYTLCFNLLPSCQFLFTAVVVIAFIFYRIFMNICMNLCTNGGGKCTSPFISSDISVLFELGNEHHNFE